MSDPGKFKIPFALMGDVADRVYVDPFEAEQGREYRCPECADVIALHSEGHVGSDPNAPVMRDPHFAHIGGGDSSCGGGNGESFQHEAAKWIAAKAIRDWVASDGPRPTFVWTCRRCGKLHRKQLGGADEVVVDEVVPEANIGKRRPDICIRHEGRYAAIEIHHTHAIDLSKIEDYITLARWVEIDAARVLEGGVEWWVRRASWELTCSPSGSLCPHELAKANAEARSLFTPRGGAVVREPSDNVIGRFKILRRTDGLFVAHGTKALESLGDGLVFDDEAAARKHAVKEMASCPK